LAPPRPPPPQCPSGSRSAQQSAAAAAVAPRSDWGRERLKKRAKNMGIGTWYEFQPLSTSPLDMLSTLEHLQVAKLGIFDDS